MNISKNLQLKLKNSRACRVKRMTGWLKSDRGNSVVRPRSLREVQGEEERDKKACRKKSEGIRRRQD